MLNTQLAPQGWTPAGKALWSQLPEAARAEVVRREYEQHQLATRVDEERQVARQFNEIATQNREIIERSGVHPLRFISDVFQSMRTLQGSDPNAKMALLRDLAMRGGVDLRMLAGVPMSPPNATGAPNAPASPGAQRTLPPELIQLLQPLVASSREWSEFKQRQQAEAQAREQQEQQQVYDEIVAFRSKPEARFFDAVKDHMVALLQSGAATSLEEAYDAAVWARPDTRAVLEGERRQAAEAQERKRLATERARQRGGQVRGGSGAAAPVAQGPRSIRDELKAGFEEVRSRV